VQGDAREGDREAALEEAPEDLGGGYGDHDGSESLGTVVVTAGRTAEALREVSSNVTVITGEEVERSTASDLSDVLRQQGFWMVDNGLAKTVQIRGMNSGNMDNTQNQARVLILVNGRRTGAIQVSQIPVANIERVEVIRGPAAVQYGTSALGGVVNVITRKGGEGGFSATLESGIGSYGLNSGSFTFSGGSGPLDLGGAFSYRERDSFSVSQFGGLRFPRTSSENKYASLEAGYSFNDTHRIGVSYSHTRDNSEWPSVGIRSYLGILKGGGSIDGDYLSYNLSIDTLGITYDGATEDGRFDWQAFYTGSHYERLGTSHDTLWGTGVTRTVTEQRVTNLGASAGYNGEYLDLDLGLDLIRYRIRGSYDGDNLTRDLGFYMTARIKPLGETLFLTLAGRYDEFGFDDRSPGGTSRRMSNLSPSLGVSYLPAEWLKIRANYSEGVRVPTAYEYFGGGDGVSYVYHPNPDLKPEESRTWEAGADVDLGFLSGSLTYFQTRWVNKIVSGDYPGGAPYFDSWYTNIAESEISGIEASLGAELGEAFDLDFQLRPFVNFTYLTRRENGDPDSVASYGGEDTLPFVPRWTLAYGASLDHPGWDLQLSATAVHTGDIFYHYSYPPAHFVKGSEFTSLDLAAEKGLFGIGPEGRYGRLKLRVEVKNALDSKNETYYDYPGPGRNYYVGLKWVY
jgi:vitamin B12 transporter